jgi:hypothetical protein
MSGPVTLTDADVWRIERLADAAMRAGHEREAIGGYALALRLRTELGMPPEDTTPERSET